MQVSRLVAFLRLMLHSWRLLVWWHFLIVSHFYLRGPTKVLLAIYFHYKPKMSVCGKDPSACVVVSDLLSAIRFR